MYSLRLSLLSCPERSVPADPGNSVQHNGKYGDFEGEQQTLAMVNRNLHIPYSHMFSIPH